MKKYLQKCMPVVKEKSSSLFRTVRKMASRITKKMIMIFSIVVAAFFVFIMFATYRVDTSLDFAETPAYQQHPRILQTWQALINREVNKNTFVPNRPFFSPSAYLKNMGAFQSGIIDGLAKYTTHLTLHITDKNLSQAAELLRYPPDIWLFGTSEDGKISKSSTQQYRYAKHALQLYMEQTKKQDFYLNKREGIEKSVYFIRSDLRQMSELLSAKIKGELPKNEDKGTSHVFYFIKGKLYVHALFLRDMIESDAIELSSIERQHLRTTLQTLHETIELEPLIVLNSRLDRTFMTNHLVYQAYGIGTAMRSLIDFQRMALE